MLDCLFLVPIDHRGIQGKLFPRYLELQSWCDKNNSAILTVNGLVFQTQVAYLIPIFGVLFGYFLMDEIITWRVLISLIIIILGIYIVKKNNKGLKK